VIADQASPHIAKSVKAFVAGQKRLELFYLPAYSPDFNPDEGVWSHLKSQELKAHQATNKEELIKKTNEALKMSDGPSDLLFISGVAARNVSERVRFGPTRRARPG
jgi:DDE superfamily endonuclease